MGCTDLTMGRSRFITIPKCAAENQIAQNFRKRANTMNLEMHSTSRPQISVDVSVFPFLANVPIIHPLKTPENLQFAGVFRRYKIGTLARNRLISKSWVLGNSKLYQTVSSVDFYKNYDRWFPAKYWSNNAEIIKNKIRNIKMLKENFSLGKGFFRKGCSQLKHARTLNLLLFLINQYWKWTYRPVLLISINLS